MGGNVAAYFCAPDLRVLTAVAGPVAPEAFLREAKMAVELAAATAGGMSEDAGEKAAALQARRGNLWSRDGFQESNLRRVLADHLLNPLELVYRPVFEGVLGEMISDEPVNDSFNLDGPLRLPESVRAAARKR